MLESGALRWTTVSQERLPCLLRFDRWLSVAFDDPGDLLGDPAAAAPQAAAFRRWDADPATRSGSNRQRAEVVHPRLINDDLRAVAELFAFVAANPVEARAHAAGRRHGTTSPAHTPPAGSARSPASRTSPPSPTATTSTTTPWRRSPPRCPCSGCPATSRCHHPRRRDTDPRRRPRRPAGDAHDLAADPHRPPRQRDPHLRLRLPLASATAVPPRTARRSPVSSYAQSKIDIAPDSILVDREVIAVIEDQQPGSVRSSPASRRVICSCGAPGTSTAPSPTSPAPTTWMLRAVQRHRRRSPTARGGRYGSATPTGSGTPG